MPEQIVPNGKLMKYIESLYFVKVKDSNLFFHNVNGSALLLVGFEGAAFFDEKNAEKLVKVNKKLEAIKIVDLAKELPVVLSGFPKGHALYGAQVRVRDFTITRN
ncbi:MAG: hypothetical protein PHX80_05340 [Candidatus Nanoarchaeia archaeon]|nr:hypothetical protein [Candidatus Nanoarchaeia archaeon]